MAKSKKEPVPVQGVYAALATPHRPGSTEADTAFLLDYLDSVIKAGVRGLVLFGATGEFIHFETDERIRPAVLAIKRSRVPVLVNVSHSTLAGAVQLAESAIYAGASGLLLMPPYFYKYGDDQIYEFYKRFVGTIGGEIPILLYNLPVFTNPLSPQLALRLLQTGWFAGIKDSSGDWGMFQSLLELRRRILFQLLVGNESVFCRGRASGADGIVSGVAAAIPELVVALDRAITAQPSNRAQPLAERLHQFLGKIAEFPTPVGIRQAATARGWNLPQMAVPLDNALESRLAEFTDWFRGWWPQVLQECNHLSGVRT